MKVLYTIRFNPIMCYFEILEHIPELERVSIIHKADEELDALRQIRKLEEKLPESNLEIILKEREAA